MIGEVVLLFVAFALLGLAASFFWSMRAGAPWVPSSRRTQRTMLELLELAPGEVLADFGAGDGGLVIEAARRYGVRAIGYEVNPVLAVLARFRVLFAGLQHQVTIRRENIFTATLPPLAAITTFLLPATNRRLGDEVLPRCLPGTRVVSYTFAFHHLSPQKVIRVGTGPAIYLYRL